MKRYTDQELSLIRRLRQKYNSMQIATMTGRTKQAIDRILSIEKKTKGAEYPKLRHGNLKHDCKEAQEWRQMIREGKNYKQIQSCIHVHPGVISRTLAMEARGELKW